MLKSCLVSQTPVTSGVWSLRTQVPVPQVAPGTQCVLAAQTGQSGMQVSDAGSQHEPLVQLGALGSHCAPVGGSQRGPSWVWTQISPEGQASSLPMSHTEPLPTS